MILELENCVQEVFLAKCNCAEHLAYFTLYFYFNNVFNNDGDVYVSAICPQRLSCNIFNAMWYYFDIQSYSPVLMLGHD